MNKFIVASLLMSVLAIPAMAMDIGTGQATATAGQAIPPAVAPTITKVTNTIGTADTMSMMPATEVVPLPPVPTTVTNVPVVAPAPILGAVPTTLSQPANAVIGATQTSTDPMMATKPMTPAVVSTPAITEPLPPFGAVSGDSPLCAPVAAAPAPGVEMAPTGTVVNPPRTIPLSVDLANALGIRGFENIVSEGPIGFITRDDQGRVFFEGKELTSNVQALCASGKPIPMGSSMTKPMMDKAPDGSPFSAMPGQSGFRMQPIIDGPNYKFPPKKKRAKKVEKPAVTEEELAPVEDSMPVKTDEPAMAPDAAAPTPSDAEADLKSMMREPAPATDVAPVATGVLPAAEAGGATTTITPVPTTDTSGAGAVGEVLGTPAKP